AGRDLPDDRLGRLCGGMLAELHRASDDFAAPHRRVPLDLDWLLEQPLQRIEPYLAHRTDHREYLGALADRVRRQVADLAGDLAWGFCHGDYHGWNVHVAEDGSATVFDFDGCGPGWRAYDLATFRHSLGLDPKKSATWPAFLAGYAEPR